MEDKVMKRIIKQFSVCVCVVLLGITLTACPDNGGGGVTEPETPLDVSGIWYFSGQISENSCNFLQDEPSFQTGVSGREIISVAQNGVNLTAVHTRGNIFGAADTFSGTVIGNSFSLTEDNPSATTVAGCTVSFVGSMEAHGIPEDATSGNGIVRLTTNHQGGDCSFLGPLPCAVVLTGPWYGSNSAKLSSPESASGASGISGLQESLKQYLN
jgi:hypothetical protein